MSNDFLSRWSRRKLGADEPSPAAPVDPIESAQAVVEADIIADDAAHAPGEMTQAELDALPDADDLTASSDITAFLRSGVPAALRNRALRRMWSIDPEIRDYVGDARDYAWDWNTPGGVPVSGPLSASTDIRQMVRDIFGTDPAAKPEGPSEPEALQAPGPAVQPLADLAEPVSPARVGTLAEPTDDVFEAQMDAAGATDPAPRTRSSRHGGALPS